ncbi:DUF3124 domain-containing protein [Leeuwenhoekiella nanhaiensis]|uniref:DUF3124 domain-containing protein n=1 Tax=Leeuwenhoekiella nanhaiensis TaxID=1655491 RepID=A0A2G1VQV5_9FLAO|nr:DUF3124 domain-containing protein [Leeuwenhoekiella nanhaiensis]PHQ29152.1 hypothetical protein CJ305_11120 [Leeuwenhoekiella nanhaiensis]
MRVTLFFIPVLLLLLACDNTKPASKSLDPINWEKRRIEIPTADSLTPAKTYLGIYSEIYSTSEHNTHDLTVTVSLRNTSESDTVILTKGVYYDTEGSPIRTYFDFPIQLKPLETVEIIIEEGDKTGGTGGNFIFDWLDDPEVTDPLFEGIMISTRGTQGLSFTVQGKRIQ